MCKIKKKFTEGKTRKTVLNSGCDKISIRHDRYLRMRVNYNAWKTRVVQLAFLVILFSCCLAHMFETDIFYFFETKTQDIVQNTKKQNTIIH